MHIFQDELCPANVLEYKFVQEPYLEEKPFSNRWCHSNSSWKVCSKNATECAWKDRCFTACIRMCIVSNYETRRTTTMVCQDCTQQNVRRVRTLRIYSAKQIFQNADVPKCRCSKMQMFQNANVPKCKCSKMQMCNVATCRCMPQLYHIPNVLAYLSLQMYPANVFKPKHSCIFVTADVFCKCVSQVCPCKCVPSGTEHFHGDK